MFRNMAIKVSTTPQVCTISTLLSIVSPPNRDAYLSYRSTEEYTSLRDYNPFVEPILTSFAVTKVSPLVLLTSTAFYPHQTHSSSREVV